MRWVVEMRTSLGFVKSRALHIYKFTQTFSLRGIKLENTRIERQQRMSSSLPPENEPAETMTNEEGIATIKGWLNQRLRIAITDSRIFEGWFKCIDRDCNIVLAGTDEFRDGTFLPPFCHESNSYRRMAETDWIDCDTRKACGESCGSVCTD